MLQSKVETELLTPSSGIQDSSELKVESTNDERSSEVKDQKAFRHTELEGYQLAKDRERRVSKVPKRYGIADLVSYALMVANDVSGEEPISYKEAMRSKQISEWLTTMKEEIASLKKNDTWVLVDKPTNKKLVGSKWVFKLNEWITGVEKSRYKARLVVKGFTQREGVDFNEVFSPVVKYSSIRVLLAITAALDLELDHMDVKTTFLHGNLDEEILMSQLEGFIEEGKKDKVCLLKKILYGLKQSPHQWYLRFDDFMLSHGYQRSQYDCCVYYKILSSGHTIYLLLYVDDMLIACKLKEEMKKLKKELSFEFEMKNLGPAKKILRMKIVRGRSEKMLFLTQTDYVRKVLDRFGMLSSKSVSTSFATHIKLSKQQEPTREVDMEYMVRILYSSAVGSIMYVMVCSRPDIAFGVGMVSRYMGNPGKSHWESIKWILRYLNGSIRHDIMFGRVNNTSCKILGFVDSDFVGDIDKRRSVTGFVFTLFRGAVRWKSSLQPVVTLSTTEAEYIAHRICK